MRGFVGQAELRNTYVEVVRDWPRRGGVRIGSFNVASDTFAVLRYGTGGRNRATDDRKVGDSEAASILRALYSQFSALDCPSMLNRQVNYGDLVPVWETAKRDGWEWRKEWPPRPLRVLR